MAKEMYMDDVSALSVKAVDFLQEQLGKEFGRRLSDAEEDAVFDAVWRELEKSSNGDYRNYN